MGKTYVKTGRRQSKTVLSTVLSIKQANEIIALPHCAPEDEMLLKSIGPTIVSLGDVIPVDGVEQPVCFITDDSRLTLTLQKYDTRWAACSFRVPQHVPPRPGFETGWIDTVDGLLKLYYAECRVLQSVDEVVDFINARHTARLVF